MLFKSQLVTQVSGSTGGTTYAHNRGGMYTRARSVPTDPQSSQQVATRMYFAQAVNQWTSVLTPTERGAWDGYAANTPVLGKLGDMIYLTGQQMYIRSVVAGVQAGFALSRFTAAPTAYNLGETGTISLGGIDGGANTFTFQIGNSPDWAGETDAALLCLISRPQNVSVNFFKSPFRFTGKAIGNATPITSAAITANAAGAEFYPIDDLKSFACVRILQADNRLSQKMIFNGIAATA